MLAAGVPRAYFTLYLRPRCRSGEEGGWQQPSADQASVLALLEHPESLSVFNCVLYKYIMLNYIEPGKSNGKRA